VRSATSLETQTEAPMLFSGGHVGTCPLRCKNHLLVRDALTCSLYGGVIS
jgi:hypothetical protein